MKTITTLFSLLALASLSFAQSEPRNEVGLLLGALSTGSREIQLPTRSQADIGSALTYQINYARRIVDAKAASLHIEVLYVSLCGEVRDFVTGNPSFNALFLSNRQHNVLTSGGIVIHF